MGLRKSGRRATRGGSRLFVTYALASLLPLLGLGGVLLQGYRDDAAREGQDQGRAQAAVIEEMAIAPALDGADLAHGLTAAQRDRLQGATGLAIFQGSLVRIRLRAFTGRVVFSDDGSTSGGIPIADPAFRAAATAGVETPGVRAWLSAEGCDCAQGYLFSRPVPWPELLDRAPDAVPALDSTVSELMAGGRR